MWLLFFAFLSILPNLNGDDIYVGNRQLFIEGEPFFVKGVNYSPVPIGASFDDGDKIGDVFFDFFNPVHVKDFKLMREMGTNTIRIYGMFPWNPQKGPSEPRDHKKFLNLAYNIRGPHIYVWVSYPISNGIFRYKIVNKKPDDDSFSVVLPTGPNSTDQIWVMDEDREEQGFQWLGSQTAEERRESDKKTYLALAEKYKDHPAVFGWVLGNELNSPQNRVNPHYWAYINELAGELKIIAPKKEVMVALIDDGMVTLKAVKKIGVDVSNIDIWGINSYRGNVSPGTNNFGVGEGSLFNEYEKISQKPLIITEFGPPSTTRKEIVEKLGLPVNIEDAANLSVFCSTGTLTDMPDRADLAADYIEGHWNDIVENFDVVSGGIVFEWQDEYWKAGDKNVQTPSNPTNINFPGGCADEEGFGINGVVLKRKNASDFPYPFVPDERVQRDQFHRLKKLWMKIEN